jgi:hypothetical protein
MLCGACAPSLSMPAARQYFTSLVRFTTVIDLQYYDVREVLMEIHCNTARLCDGTR